VRELLFDVAGVRVREERIEIRGIGRDVEPHFGAAAGPRGASASREEYASRERGCSDGASGRER
jgi:hypothetical protein